MMATGLKEHPTKLVSVWIPNSKKTDHMGQSSIVL